jgi:hypothetical protein
MNKLSSFPLFLSLWNQLQNLTTPTVHFKIAHWLQQNPKRGLLMAFRSCGKSTLVGLYAAWRLLCDPDVRIMVLAADGILAGKMVRNVKRIIERHPLTQSLMPDMRDQWAADRFTIKRATESRDPSMIAKGVMSNLTGSRADLILCDDVEVPNTCDSLPKRLDLRERLIEIDFILTPQGQVLYIGTPHHYHSIYAKDARAEYNEATPFLAHYERLEVPILDAQGNSAWDTRFSLEYINHLRQHTGAAKFDSQMMLIPTNITQGVLSVADLVPYDTKLHYSVELNQLLIGDQKITHAAAWWDPAFGAKGGDGSVCAFVYRDGQGRYYIHHIAYLKINPKDSTDEATQQCRQVAALCREYYMPRVAVEINGIGKFLPNILRREMALARAPCAVIEKSSRQNKIDRILSTLQAPLAARMIHAARALWHTPFITEIKEWQGTHNDKDDALDAVAGAISMFPIKGNPPARIGMPKWAG